MLRLKTIWCKANVIAQLIIAFVFMVVVACAAEPADEDVKSAEWWREQMTRYAQSVKDPAARSELAYAMVYIYARAGDLDAALKSAAEVKKPQLGVYVYCAIAKRQKERGDKTGREKSLSEA